MRSEFEKAFPIPAHWIEFDEKANKYYCPYVADAKASEYQSMWKVWQHQQSKVDELQKRVDAATAKWISIISILTTTESNVPDVIYKQLDELHDALCGYELEQAIKGGEA